MTEVNQIYESINDCIIYEINIVVSRIKLFLIMR